MPYGSKSAKITIMNEKYILEKISFYKFWLTFVITIDAGCIAWFVKSVSTQTISVLYITMFIIIFLTRLIFWVNYKIIVYIDKL